MGELERGGIREQLLVGALRQGPSFVVLLAILMGLYRAGDFLIREGISKGIEQIRAGYREIQEQHSADLKHVIAAFEREQEREQGFAEVVREVAASRDVMKRALEVVERMEAGEPREEGKR